MSMQRTRTLNELALSIHRAAKEVPTKQWERVGEEFARLIRLEGVDRHVGELATLVESLDHKENFQVRVRVTSARELPESVRSQIETHIHRERNQKPVAEYVVNPSLIGGVRIESDDWVVRASVGDIIRSAIQG